MNTTVDVDDLASKRMRSLETIIVGKGCVVKKGCTVMFKEPGCLKKGCAAGAVTVSALKKYEKQHGGGGFIILDIQDCFGPVIIQFKDWHKREIGINADFFCADGECMHRIMMEDAEL